MKIVHRFVPAFIIALLFLLYDIYDRSIVGIVIMGSLTLSNIGISITMAQLYRCAKHFFELGLKAQHSELTWEDISVLRKIMAEYRRQTSNEMLVLNDEDYCKEVLNRFKAQKGEKA